MRKSGKLWVEQVWALLSRPNCIHDCSDCRAKMWVVRFTVTDGSINSSWQIKMAFARLGNVGGLWHVPFDRLTRAANCVHLRNQVPSQKYSRSPKNQEVKEGKGRKRRRNRGCDIFLAPKVRKLGGQKKGGRGLRRNQKNKRSPKNENDDIVGKSWSRKGRDSFFGSQDSHIFGS